MSSTSELSKLTKLSLFEKCESIGIKKYKSKNKADLIQLIQNG